MHRPMRPCDRQIDYEIPPKIWKWGNEINISDPRQDAETTPQSRAEVKIQDDEEDIKFTSEIALFFEECNGLTDEGA